MSSTQTIVQDLITLYTSKKLRLQNEIRNYPLPIPACDAQFNDLLEKRDRLSIELNRLHKLAQDDDLAEGLAQFMAESTVIVKDIEHGFLRLNQASQE